MRTKQLAVLGLAALVVLSGCSSLSGSLAFSAQKATVGQQALSQTSYQEQGVRARNVTRTFSAAGQSKNVSVTNWIASYDQQIDLGPLGKRRAAAFSVVSTPQVSVLGQSVNPIGSYDNAKLVALLQQNYNGISDVTPVSNHTATMLGHPTNVTKFSGTATLDGRSVNVYVDVTKVKDGGDYVLALAVYPQRLSDRESKNVETLLAGIQHANASD